VQCAGVGTRGEQVSGGRRGVPPSDPVVPRRDRWCRDFGQVVGRVVRTRRQGRRRRGTGEPDAADRHTNRSARHGPRDHLAQRLFDRPSRLRATSCACGRRAPGHRGLGARRTLPCGASVHRSPGERACSGPPRGGRVVHDPHRAERSRRALSLCDERTIGGPHSERGGRRDSTLGSATLRSGQTSDAGPGLVRSADDRCAAGGNRCPRACGQHRIPR
jgi:hypothetical protein